jgi:hypothetical protein
VIESTTMEEAKKRVGKPMSTTISNSEQTRRFVHTKTHRIIPEDYLPKVEYSVWYYYKIRAGSFTRISKKDWVLIFDNLGVLVKIEEGSEE